MLYLIQQIQYIAFEHIINIEIFTYIFPFY